jgi:hypothetical protein
MAWPGTAASWSLSSWPRKPPQRQQVAQDRPILGGVDRQELAAPSAERAVEQDLQVRGLAADRGTVIDDLDPDAAIAVIDLGHARVPLGPGV